MAKMLMGQIDHARARIKQLINVKLGATPKQPKVYSVDDLKTGIRNEAITIKPAQLKRAFEMMLIREEVETIDTHGGRWQYPYNKDSIWLEVESFITTKSFDTTDEYLTQLVFKDTNDKAKAVWRLECDEFARRKAILTERATDVEDAIVLGDNAAALAAIKDFAAFEV